MFLVMGRQRVCLAVQKVEVSPVEEKKRSRERKKAKEDSKEKEEHSLVKNKNRILNGSQKKIVFGCPKGKEARRVRRKKKNRLSQRGRRTYQSEKSAGSDFNSHKGRDKDRKGKGKEGAYTQSGFQPLKHPVTKEIASPGNQMIGIPYSLTILVPLLHGMASVPMNLANHPTHVVLDLGCTQSIGPRTAIKRIQKHAW